MSQRKEHLDDADREEILRLVLCEASGVNVKEALAPYPSEERSRFRRVVVEAGMVRGGELTTRGGETIFAQPMQLTDRGRRRLKELNHRHALVTGRTERSRTEAKGSSEEGSRLPSERAHPDD